MITPFPTAQMVSNRTRFLLIVLPPLALFASASVWGVEVSPVLGEGAFARWVRKALEHPLRTPLALLLLAAAIVGPPPASRAGLPADPNARPPSHGRPSGRPLGRPLGRPSGPSPDRGDGPG